MSDTSTITPDPHDSGLTGAARDEHVDVTGREDVHHLHGGAVGLAGVLFLTVTGAAPISAMLFNTPLAIGYGNGVGAPAAFLFAMIVLAIFSIGYVAMSRKVTAAGGFYSMISHGLGRELGLATGIAGAFAYAVFEASLCGGFAFFLGQKLATIGIHISWVWPALFMVALIAALAYFHIELSARILGVALVAEVVALIIFDIVVFAQSGHASFSSINPVNAFKSLPAGHYNGHPVAAGAAGIGLFYAFWSWVGFEMAPNYGEESRDPKRNVPLSLYISVIGLGVFYTLTSWAALAGHSSPTAAAYVSQTNSAGLFFSPAEQFGDHALREVLSWLIITGSFACGMAFHNTAARYMYSLGRERILPRYLGRTHPSWHSPHTASVTQSAIAAVIVLIFAAFAGTGDAQSQAYLQLYGLMAFMGVVIILGIQALVSVAIWNYFRRVHPEEHHIIKTMFSPLVGVVAEIAVLYLAISKIDLIGSGYSYAIYLVYADCALFLIALGYAFWMKAHRPATFRNAGRLINQGLDVT